MTRLINLFALLFLFLLPAGTFAQTQPTQAKTGEEKPLGSPGTIVFCGGQKQEDCYFKIGEEKTARLSREFDGSAQNIYMRAYFGAPLETDTLSVSLYRDGTFFKGRKESNYSPTFKATFLNLTNHLWWDRKPFPEGEYCVTVAKDEQQSGATVQTVLAKGCFKIK